jgi:TonB family protein
MPDDNNRTSGARQHDTSSSTEEVLRRFREQASANLILGAKQQASASTTEELLRCLHEQASVRHNPDALNPALEQLLGSLVNLEDGVSEPALGAASTSLTLEDLAADASQSALRETPLLQPTNEAMVGCNTCGSSNPQSARFCGMCGQQLEGSSSVEARSDQPELTVAIQTVRRRRDLLPQALRSRGSGQVWKLAFLTLLCLVVANLLYQQRWWRWDLTKHWSWNSISVLRASVSMPSVAVPAVTQATAKPRRASSKESAKARSQAPVKASTRILSSAAAVSAIKTVPRRHLSIARSPNAVRDVSPVYAPGTSPAQPIGELPPIITLPGVPSLLPGSGISGGTDESPSPPKVSQLAQPILVYRVNPQYPSAARNARVQGSVALHAVIGSDGSIQQLRVLSGHPLLLTAAIEAVKKWRYRPCLLDGKPVAVETDIRVNFKGE